MYKSIEEFNGYYYGLFGELVVQRSMLPTKQYERMSKDIMESYDVESRLFYGEETKELRRELFRLEYELETLVPRRGMMFYNKLAKVLMKQYRTNYRIELEELLKKLENSKGELSGMRSGPAGNRKPTGVSREVQPRIVGTDVQVLNAATPTEGQQG